MKSTKVPQTNIPKMTAGAGGGEGRLEKSAMAGGKGSRPIMTTSGKKA